MCDLSNETKNYVCRKFANATGLDIEDVRLILLEDSRRAFIRLKKDHYTRTEEFADLWDELAELLNDEGGYILTSILWKRVPYPWKQ